MNLDPQAIEGPLYKAYAAIARIEDDPNWADQAKQYAIEAQRIDSNDPRPAIAYYHTFYEAGETPPENAILALESVFDHAGSDAGYRILLGRQLLLEDRLDTARTVLLPIAFRGHNQGQSDEDEDDMPSLDRVMDHIEAGDRDAALAEVHKILDWEPEDA